VAFEGDAEAAAPVPWELAVSGGEVGDAEGEADESAGEVSCFCVAVDDIEAIGAAEVEEAEAGEVEVEWVRGDAEAAGGDAEVGGEALR
jgi:hypothetical protein